MTDATEDSLRERLSGESMIHRLQDWNDGDTAYGVAQFTEKDRAATGKTFAEGGERFENAEERAREFYETGFPPGHVTVSVLFRATVENPRTEPNDPADPGEPPLKFATFTDVEILDWTDHTGDSDE